MVKGADRFLVAVMAAREYYCSHSEMAGLAVASVSVGKMADFRPWLLGARSRRVALSLELRGRLDFERQRQQHQGQ